MSSTEPGSSIPDSGLPALCGIAGYYRIAADPANISRDLAIHDRVSNEQDIIRAARQIGLKARQITVSDQQRLERLPTPAIVKLKSGAFAVYGGKTPAGTFRLVNPVTRHGSEHELGELYGLL